MGGRALAGSFPAGSRTDGEWWMVDTPGWWTRGAGDWMIGGRGDSRGEGKTCLRWPHDRGLALVEAAMGLGFPGRRTSDDSTDRQTDERTDQQQQPGSRTCLLAFARRTAPAQSTALQQHLLEPDTTSVKANISTRQHISSLFSAVPAPIFSPCPSDRHLV